VLSTLGRNVEARGGVGAARTELEPEPDNIG
jgi:hypothetical protein